MGKKANPQANGARRTIALLVKNKREAPVLAGLSTGYAGAVTARSQILEGLKSMKRKKKGRRELIWSVAAKAGYKKEPGVETPTERQYFLEGKGGKKEIN